MVYVTSMTSFLVSLVVSGIIIYLVTMVLGRSRGIGTAIMTAFTGSVIYALAPIVPIDFLSSIVAGIAWLFAIRHFYGMGWFRAFITAVVIWFVAGIVSRFLPTLIGPL